MSERVLLPGLRSGKASVPSSKSELHRLLLAAALTDRPTVITARGLSEDVLATAECLRALGAGIDLSRTENGETFRVTPWMPGREDGPRAADLFCRESGSTLRFLLSVAGALGRTAVFHREGRLSERPLEPLATELVRHGMTLQEDGSYLRTDGALSPGRFTLPGNVSSQYVSGLLFALPRLSGDSELLVTGKIESDAYIRMTEETLKSAGIRFTVTESREGRRYGIPGGQCGRLPETVRAGGDWSGAAFFFALGALSERGVTVLGLSETSAQGDREILNVLERFGAVTERTEDGITVRKGVLRGTVVDAAMIPDLVPPVAAVAALSEGETKIVHAERLRLKESDRLKTTVALLNALGGEAEETEDGLRIRGVRSLRGGRVFSENDHRIAMSAAVAAAGAEEKVILEGPEAVKKSFPDFFAEYDRLDRKSPEKG